MTLAFFNFYNGEFYIPAESFDWSAIIIALLGAVVTLVGYYWVTKLQVNVIKKDQFESSFFNMLSMLNQITQNASANFKNYFTGEQIILTGISFFEQLAYEVKKMDLFELQGKEMELLLKLEPQLVGKPYAEISIWEHNNGGRAAILKYEIIFNRHLSSLGQYYRYIHNMIDFAMRERRKYKDDERYINLIQAQLSNGQLVMLFYNGLSRYSLDMSVAEKFKNRLDYYQVLQNINKADILELLSSRYPMTLFRFYSTKELTECKKIRQVTIKQLDNSIWS